MNENIKVKKGTHFKHLEAGVKPIMVCIGTREQFKKENNLIPEEFHKKGTTFGRISNIDGEDKYSRHFIHCTGLVLAGIDRTSNRNISFIVHYNPLPIYTSRKILLDDILQALVEFRERCIAGTVDAVIVGGNVKDTSEKEYRNSTLDLAGRVHDVFGFEPTVVNGPKIKEDKVFDDIRFENDQRRLYLFRPRVNDSAKDYLPSDIEEKY